MAKAKAAAGTENTFERRLQAAVRAGWCTIAIWAILLTVSWLVWLIFMHTQPRWLIWLWGGQLTWPKVQEVCIWFYGAFKIVLFSFLMIVVFATLWLRRLRCAG